MSIFSSYQICSSFLNHKLFFVVFIAFVMRVKNFTKYFIFKIKTKVKVYFSFFLFDYKQEIVSF